MEKFKQEVFNIETFDSEGIVVTDIAKELVDALCNSIDGVDRLIPTSPIVVKTNKTIRIGVTEAPINLTPNNGHKLKYAITIEYIGDANSGYNG